MLLAASSGLYLGLGAALLAAVIFGLGDFGAGELGKKMSPFVCVAAIYLVEVPLLFIAMAAKSDYGNPSTNLSMFAIGALGTIGYASIIYGLSHGKVSIVMSLAGLIALIVPAVASVIIGEPTSWLVWMGVFVAAIAIVLITQTKEPELHEHKEAHFRAVRVSIISGISAGMATGIYFVGLDQFDSPILVKLFFLQLAGFFAAIIYFYVKRGSITLVKKHLSFLLILGIAYQLGQLLYPYAANRTSLVVTNIIVNLYPALTILMAKIILKEKTSRLQNFGFITAVVGLLIVSIGAGN